MSLALCSNIYNLHTISEWSLKQTFLTATTQTQDQSVALVLYYYDIM